VGFYHGLLDSAPSFMRFATGELIGRGGMGAVYRSWDQELARPVAVKVLHRDCPESAERMLREARAQAGIDHPNVCAVYEVGRLDGRPYIAMQWIDGVPLDEAVADLPVERKVHLFLTVLEAVQAAHRVGLVHRDLKPANILVETGPDGGLEPYVLDFGIARTPEPETALTRTGQVIGSPGFLSPEQARGERDVDRRSDIFSLGCVLYQVLVGRPPFTAVGLEGLLEVMEKDPDPVRRANDAVPQELATVVEKCLEKERHRRYASVPELAADLERFLAGDRVLARPASLVYRWRRRVGRHPIAASLVALAMVTAGVMGGLAWHARAGAAERAATAQRFGREVERIRLEMRLAHLAALHDLRPEKAALRDRLRRLEDELPGLGPAAQGPGQLALGRGYDALGAPRQALGHLERAWRLGHRTPATAEALALVLGTLYQEGLVDAERLPDGPARDARRRELERRYRDRVRDLLRRVGPDRAALLEARMALGEGRPEDARRVADSAAKETPWRYEAFLLLGDAIVVSVAAGRGDEAPEAMVARLEEAQEAFQHAAVEGRSDPRVHDRLCSLGGSAAGLLFFGTGEPLDSTVSQAARACRTSLVADPDRGRPHALLSGLLLMQSRDLSRRGDDPMPTISEAVAEGRAAVGRAPQRAEPLRSLGEALTFRAEYERERGIDSETTLTEAVDALERAIRLDPEDAPSYNALGLAHWERILHARLRGVDQRGAIADALAAFRRATELLPGYARAFSNLGSIYNLRVEYETSHGADPGASLNAAATAFRQAIDADPGFAYAYNNLGNVHRHRAELAVDQGESPAEDVAEASRHFALAAAKNPAWSFPHFNHGLALYELARWQVETERDPAAALDGAAAAFRRGLEIKPDLPQALRSAALVEVLRARSALNGSADGEPGPGLRAARDLIARAAALDPESGFGQELLGAVEMLAGRSGRGDPDVHFRAAERALERATELVPDGAEAYRLKAELRWYEAVRERARGRREALRNALEAGLEAAETALELNRRSAEAEVWRAELALLEAETGIDPSAARTADEAFAHAFERKPSLAHHHGEARRRAHDLAAESAVPASV